MDLELIFSITGMLAMLGWLLLLASPYIPQWSDRISGLIIPLLLSLVYVALSLFAPSGEGGGFGSLADVGQLFSEPAVLLTGWIHYLAFDLLIGAWICRDGRREKVKFWLVVPCLPLTFMFGPAGFLAYVIIREAVRRTAPAS